ncbi:synaptogyrin-4 [Ranitomeya variabilis]|uniref:synaptogyrin-4 n=1 Tax=Ranitomeya variabilis TaxID=490064 RepID=UPI004057874B
MDARIMEGRSYLRQFMNKPLIRFILSARTITRTVSGVFSFIVCGSIVSGGYQNFPISSELNCIFNENPAACGYGVGLGFLAGLLCLLFLLLDCFSPYIYSPLLHKMICIADFVCSVLGTTLWFFGFCFLAHQWAMSIPDVYPVGAGSGQTAIVFSFFSIPCWVVLSYLAFIRFSSSPAEEYKRSVEGDTFPVIRSLLLNTIQGDPLQNSNTASHYEMMSAQEMNSSFQN